MGTHLAHSNHDTPHPRLRGHSTGQPGKRCRIAGISQSKTDTPRQGLAGAVGTSLIGFALLARGATRIGMVALLVTGFLVSSAGNLLTGFAWGVAAAFAVQTVRGLGIAAMDVAHSTLIQRLAPVDKVGRVFGNFYGGIGVAAAIGYVGGGLLLDAAGPRLTFVLTGAAGVLVAVWVVAASPGRGVEWESAS